MHFKDKKKKEENSIISDMCKSGWNSKIYRRLWNDGFEKAVGKTFIQFYSSEIFVHLSFQSYDLA